MCTTTCVTPVANSTVDIQPEVEYPGGDGERDVDVDGSSSHTVEPDVIDHDVAEKLNNFGSPEVNTGSEIKNLTKSTELERELESPVNTPTSTVISDSLPSTAKRRGLTMPNLANLSNLILHSPSSQIVGTPFATNSTRYEYPFPETSGISPSSAGGTTPTTGITSISSSFGLGTSTFLGMANPSSSSPQISSSLELLQYNSAHPKLKATTNPPIPPSLVKKRNRWNLSLLSRRKSNQSSSGKPNEEDSHMLNLGFDGVLAGPQISSPLASPTEDKAKR